MAWLPLALLVGCASPRPSVAPGMPAVVRLSRAEYVDRIQAAWVAQMLACMMGWQFEHQVASTMWVDRFPKKYDVGPIDDDWYYEMCAVRAFEKYGIGLTVRQLGRQWL
jgi:hypothetical protein